MDNVIVLLCIICLLAYLLYAAVYKKALDKYYDFLNKNAPNFVYIKNKKAYNIIVIVFAMIALLYFIYELIALLIKL